MITKELNNLRNARANYVRALRRYEDKFDVVVERIRIRRQVIIDKSQQVQSRTIVVGIGENTIDRGIFLETQHREIPEELSEGNTLVILDKYED